MVSPMVVLMASAPAKPQACKMPHRHLLTMDLMLMGMLPDMVAPMPVGGFMAILTAIFLSTPKSMSTISLTTSFIRSRMSIQMI